MDVPAPREDTDAADTPEVEESAVAVTSHETRPGKIVFTEQNNSDGWIATDLVVDLEP